MLLGLQEHDGQAIVSTQLSRRNDEVCTLRERVRLLEHLLKKGNKDVDLRLKDITTLTTEVTSLR